MSALSLTDVNALSPADFATHFGDVAEHSPWVAETAGRNRPFADRDSMITAFTEAMHAATDAAKLALIRAHPDLAGKAARAGALTEASTNEQAGAGLDTLSDAEFDRFTSLNDAYKAKFGFPFIFAVKGATKHMILAAFAERLGHSAVAEFDTAMTQIARIIRFRLEDMVHP